MSTNTLLASVNLSLTQTKLNTLTLSVRKGWTPPPRISVPDWADNNQTNTTVVAQLANGKTIVGSNMLTVDDQEADSEDAKFDVKWESREVTEN